MADRIPIGPVALAAALFFGAGSSCELAGCGAGAGSTGPNDAGPKPEPDASTEGASGSDASANAATDTGLDAGSTGPDAGATAPDHAELSVQPDTSIDKVDDCAGQADFTLCNVVTAPDRWYDVCVAGRCVSPGCGDASCDTPGPHFRIPPEADHTSLVKSDAAEPITIDTITGLHWQSCAGGLRGTDCGMGAQLELPFSEAVAYCDTLRWGGLTDWYLPDAYEALTIIDNGSMSSHAYGDLSQTAFPHPPLPNAPSWTTSMEDSSYAVRLSIGSPIGFHEYLDTESVRPSTTMAVRCVRRGFSKANPAGERFIDHDNPRDKTERDVQAWVEDRATGLVWQGCPGAPGDTRCERSAKVTFEAAIAHCASLSWAGYQDWRMPTYKELHGLYSYPNAAGIDEQRFGVDPFYYDYILCGDGVSLDLRDGARVGTAQPDKGYGVLCVRGPST
jgi:Protein of unknown function (DUF1566)